MCNSFLNGVMSYLKTAEANWVIRLAHSYRRLRAETSHTSTHECKQAVWNQSQDLGIMRLAFQKCSTNKPNEYAYSSLRSTRPLSRNSRTLRIFWPVCCCRPLCAGWKEDSGEPGEKVGDRRAAGDQTEGWDPEQGPADSADGRQDSGDTPLMSCLALKV